MYYSLTVGSMELDGYGFGKVFKSFEQSKGCHAILILWILVHVRTLFHLLLAHEEKRMMKNAFEWHHYQSTADLFPRVQLRCQFWAHRFCIDQLLYCINRSFLNIL